LRHAMEQLIDSACRVKPSTNWSDRTVRLVSKKLFTKSTWNCEWRSFWQVASALSWKWSRIDHESRHVAWSQ
jgi:hypothetical protein